MGIMHNERRCLQCLCDIILVTMLRRRWRKGDLAHMGEDKYIHSFGGETWGNKPHQKRKCRWDFDVNI